MGIQNFWAIVEPSGRNISIESLRGKRLAVDISIWLHQIIRAMRTKTGETVPNAHIYVVVFRLCKLLFYGIKPVIVFDGDAPALKKQTLKRRKERAEKAGKKMEEIQRDIMLTNYVEKIKSGNVDSESPKVKEEEPENSESLTEDEFIEDEESQLNSLYSISVSDKETVYVDLPYKKEVLHIAVNTPQIYEVPKSQRSRLLAILQNTLQKRVMMFLDGCDDPEEISHRQFEAAKFRSSVMRQVYQLLREEHDREVATSNSVANGFEYYFNEDGIELTKSPELSKIESFQEASTSTRPDPFESKRRRMNDEFFTWLSEHSLHIPDEFNEDQEEEAQKVRMYTNLNELMSLNDPSVKQYPNELSLSMVGGDKKLFEEILELEKEIQESAKTKETGETGETGEMEEVEAVSSDDKKEGIVGKKRLSESAEVQRKEGKEVKNVVKKEPTNEWNEEAWNKEKEEEEEKEENKESIKNNENEDSEDVQASNDSRDSKRSVVHDDHNNHDNMESAEEDLPKKELSSPESTDKTNEKDESILKPNSSETGSNLSDQNPNKTNATPLSNDESKSEINNETNDTIKDDSENDLIDESKDAQSEQVKQLLAATTEQLEQIRKDLLQKYRHFSSQNTYVPENVIFDIVEILRIFGIPYVFAPGEAEAQCAFLNMMGLVDGVISNDSDVFAFGGKTMYRNFFLDNRFVEAYKIEDIESERCLTRERIIEIAMLEGCDYCDGVKGLGRVMALELLSFFPSLDRLAMVPQILKEAKAMADGTAVSEHVTMELLEYVRKNRKKLDLLTFGDDFCRKAVINTFLFPAVDMSLESFTWGSVQMPFLREFCSRHSGVEYDRIRKMIEPAIRNQNRTTQLQITDLLRYSNNSIVRKEKSKRLDAALERLRRSYLVSYKQNNIHIKQGVESPHSSLVYSYYAQLRR